jgi:hypothetical protein
VQIKTKILSILRVINTILQFLKLPGTNLHSLVHVYPDRKFDKEAPVEYLVELLEKGGITKSDYPVLRDILKSMALMTKASVKTIRDPDDYQYGMTRPWEDYFKHNSFHFVALLQEIGVDLREKPTKQDYELAQKMVKVLGESFVSEKEVRTLFSSLSIEKDFKMTRSAASRLHLHGSKTLYRGLHSLSRNAFKFATTVGNEWDMTRGVSTSMMREIAENFALDNQPGVGHELIFVINNPTRRGFVTDKLSGYDESEVILSGTLRITDVEQPHKNNRYLQVVYADLI